MKYTTTKKLILNFTLDSSEAIMFTKGGKHTIQIQNDRSVYEDDEEKKSPDFSFFDLVEISFQMERNQQGRFDFITGEANRHKECVSENQSP